jgi:AraC family transcriptional regulator, regulatory protein of adaptative response / methylated-DNA-[protein]-cysteine methyltransferase
MTTVIKHAGDVATLQYAVGECSLGLVLVGRSDKGVCAILLGDDSRQLVHELRDRFPQSTLVDAGVDFQELLAKVVGFIEAPEGELELPLDFHGTAFQQRVWQALTGIPVGSTASYTDIAQRIGAPKSVRAVARACGANAIAVAVPCHRVIRSDGALSGYRWGVERKQALLEREGAHV